MTVFETLVLRGLSIIIWHQVRTSLHFSAEPTKVAYDEWIADVKKAGKP